MHQIAEYGIAAHWKYKETGGSSFSKLSQKDEKFTWLRQLLDWQNDLKDAQEYIDSLKDNLFEDDVYVFTPKGDVVVLAPRATAVDFAYRIHTEVGNQMKGARINGRWSVLDTQLQNGDIVEIITSKNSHPTLDWLNFVVTPSARNKIRQWYKRSHRDENIARAKELLEKELGKSGLEAQLKSEPMQNVVARCNYMTTEDLLAGLGYGEITLKQVVNRLREEVKAQQIEEKEAENEPETELIPQTPVRDLNAHKNSKFPIIGIEGMLYYIAGCCNPLPGEAISGVVTRNARGIAIHRQGCPNIEKVSGDRLIPVSWNSTDNNTRPHTYPVDIQIETIDRVGMLRDILARLSDENINVLNATVKTNFGKPALISLSLEVEDCRQLQCSLKKIRNMSDILNVRRLSQLDCNN